MGSWDTSSKWQPTALGELISLRKGVSYKGEFLDKPGPRLLGLGTVVPGGGLKLDEARTYSGPIREDQRIMSGELLVALTDITQEGKVLGSPGLVPRTENGGFAVTHHVARVQIKVPTRLDTRFLYYLLRGQEFKDYVRGVSMGTTVRAVSIDDVEAFEAAIPPLPEQRAIARVLGSLDDKIELNRRMNQTLEDICRALFKFWFVDFGPVRAKKEGRWKKGESLPGMPADMWDLWPSEFEESEIGEIPKEWEIRPLGEIASFTRGISYRGEDLAESDTALVNLKCAGRGGAYREDGLKAYRGPFKEEQVVEPGDVVVSHTDVTQRAEVIGRAYVVRPSSRFVRLVASLDMAIVRPTSGGQTREYFAYALSEERFRDHAYGYTNGTTVLHLSSQALTDYPHLVPPAEVVRRFSEAVSPGHELIADHSLETDTLTRTRDALLPRFLSGEIRVSQAGAP